MVKSPYSRVYFISFYRFSVSSHFIPIRNGRTSPSATGFSTCHRSRPDLVAAILEDGGISEEPYHWDPLRDLKVHGCKDTDISPKSWVEHVGRSMNIPCWRKKPLFCFCVFREGAVAFKMPCTTNTLTVFISPELMSNAGSS